MAALTEQAVEDTAALPRVLSGRMRVRDTDDAGSLEAVAR